ncbi:Ppx/GppA family phosphatase [Evansella cellulosilytica]|uniref:Ppx/GppA phosphatase n=1 Tax=Evansella cellulosilytica (strain ATCC 21833 / DSM 2522 / FERM P-1141 / JCM 9156 / N-4) TaxID=649639 RepID=E6TWU4_EVAC2|nr:Ppx/GppA family phosphatase [Evansella cellulosilytica]ADU29894.1 Ppx/GppA phosphatase [Evansella cellulosilytica DSM 2522]
MKQQIGIIDMGSNSIRFVVYEVNEDGCIKEIQNLKVVARLSSYIDAKGSMVDDGIDVILHTLERFSTISNQYDLTTQRCVATAAIRNATNQQAILSAINQSSDFLIDVLSDEEEAYYGYLAVTNSTNIKDGMTIDIGGGSTEITYYENRKLIHSHSFPFGAITLKKFIEGDTPTDTEQAQLLAFLHKHYNTLSWIKNRRVPVIGIGGTARNLALIHQNELGYPLAGLHQYEMTKQQVAETNNTLKKLPLKERQQVDGLSKDRADIIIPAITAIEALITIAQSNTFIVSNKGLRDGLFSEIYLKPMGITQYPFVPEESLYQLSLDYHLNIKDQKRIAILASYVANELNAHVHSLIPKKYGKLLQWAARIFYIGASIHPESKSQHTFYLLTNQSIDGLSHKERLMLACIASFKSRSQLKHYLNAYHDMLSDEEMKNVELLGAICKFCYSLNRTKRDVIHEIKVAIEKEKWLFIMYYENDPYFEKVQAQKNKKHLEKYFKKDIELVFKRLNN